MDLNARPGNEVHKLLKTYPPSTLPETTKKDLAKFMEKKLAATDRTTCRSRQ